MELRGHNPAGPDDAKRRFEEARLETAQEVRERSERARQALEGFSEQRSESLRQVREETVQRQLDRADALKDVAREHRTARTEAPRADAIELSPVARAQTESVDAERQKWLEALRTEIDTGRLLTQERLERSARGMLTREG